MRLERICVPPDGAPTSMDTDLATNHSCRKIGLLAGWGRFPILVAERLRQSGYEVYCLGIQGHADPQLRELCHDYADVGVGKMRRQMQFFHRHGVTRATMAGKIFKTILFERLAWLKYFPDLMFWRFFWRNLFTSRGNRNDDSMLMTVVDAYQASGIEFAPATDFAPELLVKKGLLTDRRLTRYQQRDIRFGWELAKQMGRLDIGQTVVVKGQAVLAVEAIEGTDECIRRAGSLCPAGGFTVVKVAKPQQDMRFDVPTIGLGTLQMIRQSGGSVLAIEANRTIMLDQSETIEYANHHKIKLVAIDAADMLQQTPFAA